MYKVHVLSLIPYFVYMIQRHNFLSLLKPTDSGYPRILALGICYHSNQEIVICKIGRWRLRQEHEQGHERGLNHVPIWKVGYVMHPWGILRGWKY